MAPGLTYNALKKINPCKDRVKEVTALLGGARKWGTNPVTAEQARAAGVTLEDVFWAASALAREDKDVNRRMLLWIADCAAHVLHIYEKSGASTAPRDAIAAGRKFARGEIGDDDRASASAAASDAAWAARVVSDAATDSARYAASYAASYAARTAWNAASDAAWAVRAVARPARAASYTAWAAWAAEQQWQFDRLVLWLSDEESEDWPMPELAHDQAEASREF